jgi:hypothetical protein
MSYIIQLKPAKCWLSIFACAALTQACGGSNDSIRQSDANDMKRESSADKTAEPDFVFIAKTELKLNIQPGGELKLTNLSWTEKAEHGSRANFPKLIFHDATKVEWKGKTLYQARSTDDLRSYLMVNGEKLAFRNKDFQPRSKLLTIDSGAFDMASNRFQGDAAVKFANESQTVNLPVLRRFDQCRHFALTDICRDYKLAGEISAYSPEKQGNLLISTGALGIDGSGLDTKLEFDIYSGEFVDLVATVSRSNGPYYIEAKGTIDGDAQVFVQSLNSEKAVITGTRPRFEGIAGEIHQACFNRYQSLALKSGEKPPGRANYFSPFELKYRTEFEKNASWYLNSYDSSTAKLEPSEVAGWKSFTSMVFAVSSRDDLQAKIQEMYTEKCRQYTIDKKEF